MLPHVKKVNVSIERYKKLFLGEHKLLTKLQTIVKFPLGSISFCFSNSFAFGKALPYPQELWKI